MSSLKITTILASMLLFLSSTNVYGKEKPTIPPYETFDKVNKPYCGTLLKTDTYTPDLCEGFIKNETQYSFYPYDNGTIDINQYVLEYGKHIPQFIIYFVSLINQWGAKDRVVVLERKRKLLIWKNWSVVFESNDFLERKEREKFVLFIAKKYGIGFLTE